MPTKNYIRRKKIGISSEIISDVMNDLAIAQGKDPIIKAPNEIGEVTVYSKRQYIDELKKKQAQYLADMGKYSKDSAQWAQANQSYQDSLNLYTGTLEGATKTAIETARGFQTNRVNDINYIKSGKGVKYWEDILLEKSAKGKISEDDKKWYNQQIQKAKEEQKYYSDPANIKKETNDSYSSDMLNFDLGTGYQLKHGKEKYKNKYDYPDTGYMFTPIVPYKDQPLSEYVPYLKDFIKYREEEINKAVKENKSSVSVSGMAATTINGAKAEIDEAKNLLKNLSSKIKPIGYTMGLEDLSRPIYKKPVFEPVKPKKPVGKNINYDPKYENMKMRTLWANKAKADPEVKIGVLNSLEYGDERKGFTIEEAMKFPKEIRDMYNIDFIYKQIQDKKKK